MLPDDTTRNAASLGELMKRNRRPREEEDGADSSSQLSRKRKTDASVALYDDLSS